MDSIKSSYYYFTVAGTCEKSQWALGRGTTFSRPSARPWAQVGGHH